MDLTKLSDEELESLYQQKLAESKQAATTDLTKLSDDELEKLYQQKLAESKQSPAVANAKPKKTSEADKVYSFFTGAAQGAVDTMLLPGNLLARGINKLAGKNIAPIADFNLSEEQVGGPATSKPFQIAGEIGSTFMAPIPAVNVLSKAAKLGNAGKAMQRVARIGDSALTGGAASAGYAANREGSNLDDAGLNGMLWGALLRGGFEAPGAIADVTKALIPLKASASPARIAEVQKAAQGLPVDIGTAAEIPFLRSMYKTMLPNVPFSGAAQNMQKVSDGLENRTLDFLKDLRGGKSAKDLPQFLADEVAANYKAMRKSVSSKFKAVRKEAKNIDATILPKTQQIAKEALNENQKLIAAGQDGFLPKDEISRLEKIVNASIEPEVTKTASFNPVTAKMEVQTVTKEPTKASFAIRDQLRKDFSRDARRHARDDNQRVADLYGRLEDSLQADLEDVLTNAGRPDLVGTWQSGRQEHAVNVVPYRELRALAKAKKEPTKIHELLTTDKARKLYEHLSPEAKNAVQYRFLTQGKTKDSRAQKVTSRFANVEEGEQARLFGDNAGKINDLNVLNDIVKEYRPVLNNPSTGVQASNFQKMLAFLGAGYAGGAALPLVPASVGALFGVTAVPYAANKAVKALSNPKAFEKAINAQKPKAAKPEKPILNKKAADRLARALAYQMNAKK